MGVWVPHRLGRLGLRIKSASVVVGRSLCDPETRQVPPLSMKMGGADLMHG